MVGSGLILKYCTMKAKEEQSSLLIRSIIGKEKSFLTLSPGPYVTRVEPLRNPTIKFGSYSCPQILD